MCVMYGCLLYLLVLSLHLFGYFLALPSLLLSKIFSNTCYCDFFSVMFNPIRIAGLSLQLYFSSLFLPY